MPDRRNREQRLYWPLAIAVGAIALAVGALWMLHNIRSGLQEAYAKWGLAEIIIAYAEDHEREPPES